MSFTKITNAGFGLTTGTLVGVAASFSSTVSVGGTLTYEDVTNVDSVGLITARNGIEITDKGVQVGTGATVDSAAANTLTFLTGGSEAARFDSSQRLLLGNTSPRSNAPGADVGFQIEGASGGPTNKRFIQYIFGSGDGSGPYFGLAKHRGTSVGGNTIVVNGDELGGIYFQGADGTNFKQGASILGFVDGTPGTNDMPGRLVFSTTADGASSATERLRIDSSGVVKIEQDSADRDLRLISTGANGANMLFQNSASGTGTSDGLFSGIDSSSIGYLWHFENQPLVFATNNTEKLRITSGGQVLVNTNAARSNFNDSSIETKIQIEAAGDDDSAALSIISNAGTTNSDKRSGLLVLGRTRGTSNGATTVVVQDDQVGMIEFKGMDGTSFTTAASIKAQVDGSCGTDDMPGRLVFSTSADGSGVPTERLRIDNSGNINLVSGSSSLTNLNFTENQLNTYARIEGGKSGSGVGDLRFYTYSGGLSEALRIDSSGRLLLGATTPGSGGGDDLTIATSGATGMTIRSGTSSKGALYFADGTSGADQYRGYLEYDHNGDYLRIGTNDVERMRLDSSGRLLFAKTSAGVGNRGAELRTGSGDYAGAFCSDQHTVILVNRNTDDGGLVQFRQANSIEGTISVSGGTVSYNGAHLSRWSQLPGGVERTEILRGSVLSNLDEMCEWGEEDNEQLNRMKVSDVEGDKNVSGVFQDWDDDDDTYVNDFYCAMTGDFVIRIAQGTTVARGDLLMSAGDGTAKPQDDDIMRSKTIAKVTSTTVSVTYSDGSYCVPCVLMAC